MRYPTREYQSDPPSHRRPSQPPIHASCNATPQPRLTGPAISGAVPPCRPAGVRAMAGSGPSGSRASLPNDDPSDHSKPQFSQRRAGTESGPYRPCGPVAYFCDTHTFHRIASRCGNQLREWMGIEPTRRLFSRHNGFEARGGHQIRVHPLIPIAENRFRNAEGTLGIALSGKPAFNRHHQSSRIRRRRSINFRWRRRTMNPSKPAERQFAARIDPADDVAAGSVGTWRLTVTAGVRGDRNRRWVSRFHRQRFRLGNAAVRRSGGGGVS